VKCYACYDCFVLWLVYSALFVAAFEELFVEDDSDILSSHLALVTWWYCIVLTIIPGILTFCCLFGVMEAGGYGMGLVNCRL
jgi:hypothetical protein